MHSDTSADPDVTATAILVLGILLLVGLPLATIGLSVANGWL